MFNLSEFKNPSSVYRTAPFWALNGKLEDDELKRQINEFKNQGMGGAFLHPRGGLVTEYLTEDFWHAVEVCVKEMARLNMTCWLYDEDRFPSGVAGGKVPALSPDYAGKYINRQGEVKPGHKSAVYNNQSFVDVCSADAIKEFIRLTHDEYYNRFKEYFGSTIKAMFTDEPNLIRADGLPWTKDFDVLFKEKYGYEISVNDLFEETETSNRTRFHYWSLISELFVNSFSKQIHDWCEERNIAYTGHFWEHEFPKPDLQGSVMPQYAQMQYPGIDMLFVSDTTRPEQYSNDLIVKEVSSVANQLGKKRVLTETNGASGWGLDFAYQKRATDWQLAQGINLFCQHLSLYSMEGYRKRDFPLSYLDHQPWWQDYKILGDYIGRMSYALSRGKYIAETLVLHPSSSTWLVYDNPQKLERLGSSAKELVKTLNQHRVLFDLGDDVIMSEHARVKDGHLHIGEMKYKTVFVPEMYLLRESTFNLLNEFAKQGGKIIYTGETPTLLEGEYSNEVAEFFAAHVIKTECDAELITSLNLKRVKLFERDEKNIKNVYGHMRKLENEKLIFLCNIDMEETYELSMPVPYTKCVKRLDGITGEEIILHADKNGNINFTLHPIESALFILTEVNCETLQSCKNLQPSGGEQNENTVKQCEGTTNSIVLKDWRVQLKDPNAYNLQFCRASLNGESFGNIADVLKIDDEFKDKLGIDRGNIFSRQPWMYNCKEKQNVNSVKAEYPFTIAEMPKGKLYAVAEQPEIFAVYINDALIKPTGEFYKDAAFPLYDITAHVKLGENIIRIETDKYGVLVNLESVYVVGNFKLKNNGIYAMGEILLGDIAEQGYPYYSGRVEYCSDFFTDYNFSSAKLEFGKFFGVTATVKLNGEKLQTVGWLPYSVDLTGKLVKGQNTVSIEIANSLQNLLGPFGAEANQHLVTPGSFYAEKHEVFSPVGFSGHAKIEMEYEEVKPIGEQK